MIKTQHCPNCETQAVKSEMLRGAVLGLLDMLSEYNLDSEQAGRAYAALEATKEVPPAEAGGGQ